jgi:hypothetical protein
VASDPMIRRQYKFSRPLDLNESTVLSLLIGWRKGSSAIMGDDGVTGCIAHPDDIETFFKEARRWPRKLTAKVVKPSTNGAALVAQ